jgi:hypothetical protein
MEGHGAIFLVTPLFVIIGMLPYSVFLVQTIPISLEEKKGKPSAYLFYGDRSHHCCFFFHFPNQTAQLYGARIPISGHPDRILFFPA